MGIAFKSVNGMHRDAIVLEVLTKLMNAGPSSPFEALKKQGVVHDVMPSWERMLDPFVVTRLYSPCGLLQTLPVKLRSRTQRRR